MAEEPKEPEAPIIPLRIIEGSGTGAKTTPIDEERRLTHEQIRGVIQLNDRSRVLLAQLGEAETKILKMAGEKIEIYKEYMQVQEALMGQAKEAARKVGIDPEDDSKGWTLNIDAGSFVRTR